MLASSREMAVTGMVTQRIKPVRVSIDWQGANSSAISVIVSAPCKSHVTSA